MSRGPSFYRDSVLNNVDLRGLGWLYNQLSTLEAEDVPGPQLLQKLGVEPPRLDGQVVQVALLVALGQNGLLHRLLADQAVDVHLPGLTYAVAPVLSLHRAARLSA